MPPRASHSDLPAERDPRTTTAVVLAAAFLLMGLAGIVLPFTRDDVVDIADAALTIANALGTIYAAVRVWWSGTADPSG